MEEKKKVYAYKFIGGATAVCMDCIDFRCLMIAILLLAKCKWLNRFEFNLK